MKPLRLFLLVLFALVASTAVARTWTDKKGNKTQAKFVRYHEGNVVLLRGTKVILVPFDDLSEEDQDYVRKELDKKGQGHLLPPKSSPNASGDDSKDEPAAERTWTDVQGRTIRARMLRLSGDSVVLLFKGREVTVPLERLSPADRQYVQEQEAKRLAKKSPPAQPPAPPVQPPSSPMQPMPGPRFTPPPHHSPPPYQPPSPPMYQPPAPQPPPEIPRPHINVPSFPNHPLPQFNQREKGYICSHCRKQLPPNIGVGDRCPYCGTFLAYEQDEFGRITKRAPIWRYITIGGIVPLIGLVIALILRFLRND